jgi:hypothetical protein
MPVNRGKRAWRAPIPHLFMNHQRQIIKKVSYKKKKEKKKNYTGQKKTRKKKENKYKNHK